MKAKIFPLLGLIGAILWSAAIFIRGSTVALSPWMQGLLGVTPNFAVVWLGVGTGLTLIPHVFHRSLSKGQRYGAIALMLGILLLSEIIHWAFLGAGFDGLDMLASVVAAIPLLALNALGA